MAVLMAAWLLTGQDAADEAAQGLTPEATAEAAAPSSGDAQPAASWRFTGDALLRYEAVRNAPNPLTSDFERLRLRLRPGVEGPIVPGRLRAGAGLLISA